MSRKCMFAHTQLTGESFPGYVNISEIEKDPEMCEIIVRQPGEGGMKQASLPVSRAILQELAVQVLLHLGAPTGSVFRTPTLNPGLDIPKMHP